LDLQFDDDDNFNDDNKFDDDDNNFLSLKYLDLYSFAECKD